MYINDADQAVSAAESTGYLRDDQVTRSGILAAVEFAEQAGLVTSTLPERVRDFNDAVEVVDETAEQQAGIGGNRLPDGFSEYESEHSRFQSDLHTYTSNYAKDYADGSRVEVDHRSWDPSDPFEMEPDRASAEARLHDLGRTFTYSEGWEERY